MKSKSPGPFSECTRSPLFARAEVSDNQSMRAELMLALRLFTILMFRLLLAKDPLVTIEDTGSTNRPGLRVPFDREGEATVKSRSGDTRHIKLAQSISKHFMLDLEAVGPLIDIPVVHCMKSVSF